MAYTEGLTSCSSRSYLDWQSRWNSRPGNNYRRRGNQCFQATPQYSQQKLSSSCNINSANRKKEKLHSLRLHFNSINNTTFFVSTICDLLIDHAPKKFSHIGIEYADLTLITIPNFNSTDINKYLKASIINDKANYMISAYPWYQSITPTNWNISDYIEHCKICDIPRRDLSKIIKLRFFQPINSQCCYCNIDTMTMTHILRDETIASPSNHLDPATRIPNLETT